MALLMNKQDQRSELQERIAAELREKAKRTNQPAGTTFDGVEDVGYLDGTKKTTTLAWAWMVILAMAIGVVVMFLMQ